MTTEGNLCWNNWQFFPKNFHSQSDEICNRKMNLKLAEVTNVKACKKCQVVQLKIGQQWWNHGLGIRATFLKLFITDPHDGSEFTHGNWYRLESWEEKLIHQVGVSPFRGIRTGWRNGLIGTVRSSINRNAKSYACGEAIIVTRICWVFFSSKAA